MEVDVTSRVGNRSGCRCWRPLELRLARYSKAQTSAFNDVDSRLLSEWSASAGAGRPRVAAAADLTSFDSGLYGRPRRSTAHTEIKPLRMKSLRCQVIARTAMSGVPGHDAGLIESTLIVHTA